MAKYIFRWKRDNIEVAPSKCDSKAGCWEWAIKNLRGMSETDGQAERFIRRNGEVIPFTK